MKSEKKEMERLRTSDVAYPKSAIDYFAIMKTNDVVVFDQAKELSLRLRRELGIGSRRTARLERDAFGGA